MNKKLFILFAVISILFLINSVNAVEGNIQSINTTDDHLYQINSDDTANPISSNVNSEKLEGTFTQQSSTIEVSDDYDADGEYWVDESSPCIKVKIKTGGKYSTDGKIIIECDGNTIEEDHATKVGYNSKLGHIYGFTVNLDNFINIRAKSTKNIKITFIGNLYNVTNKNTGEHLQLPKVKDSTITIKVKTGTKTITVNNEYNTKFELSSTDYKYIKSGDYIDGIDIYYLSVCTGTVKKLAKTTWKKKSVFVFKIGKTIKIGKKKFKTIKLAKKYVKKTFKMAFKGGKYIKIYKKGKKYYQLWKVPVKHYKNVKVYKEVKGQIHNWNNCPELWYDFYNTKGDHVYQLDDLSFI